MSLVLITNPPSTLVESSHWTDFVAREDISNIGTGLSIPIFTLTDWDGTTTKPEIAEGSIIEVGGSIYQADANTSLTDEGGLTNGTVHIKLVPTGGGATVVPTLTNDSIPAWDATKGGWYDSDDKFLPFEMTKTSAVYTVKSEFIDQNKTVKTGTGGGILTDNAFLKTKVIEIGDWDMNATVNVNVTHGLDRNKIRYFEAIIRNDADNASYPIDHSIISVSGARVLGATTVQLLRLEGGFFDDNNFNSTSYNRGFVTITYEV